MPMCLSYRSDRGISINYLYGGKSSTKGQRAPVWCLGMGSSTLEPLSIKNRILWSANGIFFFILRCSLMTWGHFSKVNISAGGQLGWQGHRGQLPPCPRPLSQPMHSTMLAKKELQSPCTVTLFILFLYFQWNLLNPTKLKLIVNERSSQMMSTNLFEGNTAITVAMRTSRSMIQKQTSIMFTFGTHIHTVTTTFVNQNPTMTMPLTVRLGWGIYANNSISLQ